MLNIKLEAYFKAYFMEVKTMEILIINIGNVDTDAVKQLGYEDRTILEAVTAEIHINSDYMEAETSINNIIRLSHELTAFYIELEDNKSLEAFRDSILNLDFMGIFEDNINI